ncbi:MAG: hypothetical protein QX199_07330, partial [Methylococcaceae bacterium]
MAFPANLGGVCRKRQFSLSLEPAYSGLPGYSWDNCTNGISRLCSLSNNNSNVNYSYDSHGRITGKTQSVGASPLTV